MGHSSQCMQIFTDRMTPMHVEAGGLSNRGGVGLIENMVETVLVVTAVHIIHPADAGTEMKTWPQRALVGVRIDDFFVTELKAIKDPNFRGSVAQRNLTATEGAHIIRKDEIRVLARGRKRRMEGPHHPPTVFDGQKTDRGIPGLLTMHQGQLHIVGVDAQTADGIGIVGGHGLVLGPEDG